MESIKVRSANPEDAPAIAKIHVETWQSAYRGQIPDEYLDSLSIEKRSEGWRKQLSEDKPGIYHYVAEVEGAVAGWAVAGKSRDDDATPGVGELHAIYVHPQFAGKGVGGVIMDQAIADLKADGYKTATLWVLETNEPTRKFYEHKGWQADGATKDDVRDTFTLHEVRYLKDLLS